MLWRDGGGEWRCFADKCAHRNAPLSEGRIEPTTGSIMCSYHGTSLVGPGAAAALNRPAESLFNAGKLGGSSAAVRLQMAPLFKHPLLVISAWCESEGVWMVSGRSEIYTRLLVAGWQFNGEGRAVSIPQARFDSEAGEATALRSKRSCAVTYPTQVRVYLAALSCRHDLQSHAGPQQLQVSQGEIRI